MAVFNNPDLFVQSWYVVDRSRRVRRREAKTFDLLGRRMAIYRGESGRLHALDARCPHLGADLGLGSVAGERIRCRFHGWTFDGDGACTSNPARADAYACEDRYGFIWLFNAPRPAFPVPGWDGRAYALPPQTIEAHPHLVACNGLDVDHFESVHQIRLLEPPRLEQPDAFRTVMHLRLAFAGRGAADRFLRALGGRDVRVVFTTWGGNAATIDAMLGRIPVRVLFTHRPEGTRSLSRTFLFPSGAAALPVVVATVARIVSGDRELLDRLDFRENLTEGDWPLQAFIRQVNAMRVFPEGR